MGPGILPETTVGVNNRPFHLQMPTKALSCKKEAICEHGPEAPSCPVGQGSFKLDCFKVEKCPMVRRVQMWNSCWKSLKWRETFPACYQRSVQKPASLMIWWWYGQLACFGGHYECWKVYKGFRAKYAPLQKTCISEKALCISAGQCKTSYCSYYNSMAL